MRRTGEAAGTNDTHTALVIGGGIGIAPDGQDSLAAIGLGDLVPSLGLPMRSYVLENGNGRRLGEFGTPEGLPTTRFVWRADLYRALYDAAAARRVRIVHGKRFVDAAFAKPERWAWQFDHHTDWDAPVGAAPVPTAP